MSDVRLAPAPVARPSTWTSQAGACRPRARPWRTGSFRPPPWAPAPSASLCRSGATDTVSVTGAELDTAAWDARARALGGRLESVAAGRTVRLLLPVCADPDIEDAR